MNINLTAIRRNRTETTVSIEFSGIKNHDFQLVDPPGHLIANSKGQYGVILHFKGTKNAKIETGGFDAIEFKVDFNIEEVENIRVFYYNDSFAFDETVLKCFNNFFEKYGLSENAPREVPCPKLDTKKIDIPRQGGNGGVVGIVNIP